MAQAIYRDGKYILVINKEEVSVVWAVTNASVYLEPETGGSIEPHSLAVWRELENLRNRTDAGFTKIVMRKRK